MTATSPADAGLLRLADIDPELVGLPEALAAVGARWQLHDVRWTPGREVRLSYLVSGRSGETRFTAVRVDAAGSHRHDYRDDRALPGLSGATRPDVVAERLAGVLGHEPQQVRVTPVRYRPGSRCVVRYDLLDDGRPTTLFAKVFGPAEHARQEAVLTVLDRPGPAGHVVPDLVAAWPDLQTLVTREVPGTSLSGLLGRTGAEHPRESLPRRLGDLVARLHAGSDLPTDLPGGSAWTPEDQWAYLSRTMEAARLADPATWQSLRRVLDGLAPGRRVTTGGAVPVHGSLRPGQVVVTPQRRLMLLDADRVAMSQPERDLGSVAAHVTWQALRHPDRAARLRRAVVDVVRQYEQQAGPLDPERLLWWRAAYLLQIATRRYRRLEVADWELVPHLVDLAEDTARAAATLAQPRTSAGPPALGHVAAALPGTVAVGSVERLGEAAGRRSSARYRLGTRQRPGGYVVAKTFLDGSRAVRLYDHLRTLHGDGFGTGWLRVPEPLALLPEQRTVLYRSFDGVPLSGITDPDARVAGVRDAARWLAALHSSEVVLPRRFSPAQEARSVGHWAEEIAQTDPLAGVRARRMAEEWPRLLSRTAPATEVPVHKDFHPGHVLIGDGVCVIDLDELRLGDPALDLAHFAAHLALDPRAEAAGLAAVFHGEYAARTGWADPGTYRLFEAYVWLKIAKQWAVGSGPGAGSTEEQRRAGLLAALAQGERCLNA